MNKLAAADVIRDLVSDWSLDRTTPFIGSEGNDWHPRRAVSEGNVAYVTMTSGHLDLATCEWVELEKTFKVTVEDVTDTHAWEG